MGEKTYGLNGTDGLGASDDVDMFGLNEFGEVADVVGAAVGSAAQTLGAIAVRKLVPSMRKHSEMIGGLVGMAAGGAMMLRATTRQAGKAAMIVAGVSGGLRVLEQLVFADSAPKLEGVEIEKIPTLGGVVFENMPVLQGNSGLGLTTMQQTPTLSGAMPTLVGANMPQLVGTSFGERAQQVEMNGGPQISGLSSFYGATLFGPGN